MPTPSLITADGVALAARRWLTDTTPRGAVVLVHGFSAHRDHPEVVATAEALHQRRLDVVTYDARGHGGSGGRSTLGDLEAHDVAAAVELAASRADRIVLVGASMGAIAALRYASTDPSLAGVVAVSCPARWRLPRSAAGLASALLTRTIPGRLLADRLMRVRIAPRWTNPLPPVELVSLLASPLVVVHGAADRFISSTDAHELFAAARRPCRLEIVAGMGHAFGPPATPTIVGAVEWILGDSR